MSLFGSKQEQEKSPEYRQATGAAQAGESTGNGGDTPAGESTGASEKEDDILEIVKDYSKRYPENKTFFVASDLTVFLQHAQSEAIFHQGQLGGGKVAAVNRID